jgi:hypothetical protein
MRLESMHRTFITGQPCYRMIRLLLVVALAVGTVDCFSVNTQQSSSYASSVEGSPSPPQVEPQAEELDPFGPPSPSAHLQVGDDPLVFPRADDGSSYEVHRLSQKPHIFLLKNFVSPQDCQAIIQGASNNMVAAETTEGDGAVFRRNCRVAWCENFDVPLQLGQVAGNLMLPDEVKMSFGAGCEKLQVLHYFDAGGEFVLHHDGVSRVMTVIYYLNGVAGTWFPLAHKDICAHMMPNHRDQALELAKDCVPGRDGLLVAGRQSPLLKDARDENTVVIEAGDAVAFYNYHQLEGEEGGEAVNWQCLHAGLPTTAEEGDKWIANHWMHAPAVFRNEKTHFPAE